MTNDLAIVIPAFKARFLEAALASLAAQTDGRFRVVIGDDASPDPLEQVASAFRDRLDLVYHRFSDNLGARSLPAQWNRCVALSHEPWVWLFSDDDVADPGCVAAWRSALAGGGTARDVYRFQTRIIDEQGRTLGLNPPHPAGERSLQFLYFRLRCQRLSFACEYVFSRAAFEREGGFVDLPLAWCSDDASWALFGRTTGIAAVDGPRVGWRSSHANISGRPGKQAGAAKREAILRFLEWLSPRIGADLADAETDPALVRDAMRDWFWHQLVVANAPCDTASLARLSAVAGGPRESARRLRHNLLLPARRLKQGSRS